MTLLSTWMRVFSVVTLACRIVAFQDGKSERSQSFDRDPQWDGVNNRVAVQRTVRQDFGFSATNHAGRAAGEIGGFITPAAEPAYYGKPIALKTLNDPLSASGTLEFTGRKFHALIGFFNTGTVNEWRTPNTIALRVQGRGEYAYVYLEYCTDRWRAGGDSPQGFTSKDPTTGKQTMLEFTLGAKHNWSIKYDPAGSDGNGSISARIDDAEAVCNLAPDHKADGGSFNRFGLLNIVKSVDDGGELWLDDLTVNGEREAFDSDPKWDGFHNRRTYSTSDVRPCFDFGYSPTHFAGGKAPGELGGLVFRGDGRYKQKMGCYGDRLETLSLDKPLHARGKIAMRRGVSDSTSLIGFYNSFESMRIYDAQDAGTPPSFLGVAVEGPSGEGFYAYPLYHLKVGRWRDGRRNGPPRILPDGTQHDWSLDYDPNAAGGVGQITVSLDGRAVSLQLGPGDKLAGTRFDRFGLITTRIDGNGQRIYFDDLTYTCKQD